MFPGKQNEMKKKTTEWWHMTGMLNVKAAEVP